jgi:AraC family transcriptional regulator of adaptative response / DNA-3-methyladenine glycosylase II
VDARWRAAARHLADDPLLAPSFARWPGLRVPGAWDGFEWAVRVVLGQHVSVRAASTFTERLVTRFGESAAPGAPGRLFPSPGRLSRAQIEVIGVTRGRAGAVRALAAAVTEDPSMLAAGGDPATLRARLLALPGIGPWTAEVVAMRALADADAFPAGDLVLRRAAGGLGGTELRRRAERWRPYRAYAAMALWWGVAHRP